MKFSSHRKAFFLGALFLTLLLSLSMFSHPAAAQTFKIAANTPKGQTLYTQFTMYHEDYRHRTTNYRKGILIPVNTQVKFVDAGRSSIVVKLPDGYNLTVENVEKYSGEGIDGIFNRTFSTQPVDLSRFGRKERRGIRAGRALPGMSKAAVIVAMGYPPQHETPSLKLNKWRYWQNRFNTFLVHFENERVSYINE